MDKETFSEKVLSNEQMLYRIAKTILFSDSDCEDAVAQAIYKAYAALPRLREEQYFTTWLVRILLNECYRVQREKRRQTVFSEYMAADGEREVENRTELYEAVASLPEKIRITVELYYIEGYSVEETGKILGIPPGTVKSRLSAGRQKLKTILEE